MPDTMVIDTSGGAWVDRNGKLKAGKGGDLLVTATLSPTEELDLAALAITRAPTVSAATVRSRSPPATRSRSRMVRPSCRRRPMSMATTRTIRMSTGSGCRRRRRPERPKRGPMVLAPSFFENSGFSKHHAVCAGRLGERWRAGHATSASLQLNARRACSSMAIPARRRAVRVLRAVRHGHLRRRDAGYLAPERRSASLRKGMDIEIGRARSASARTACSPRKSGGSFKFNQGADI